jgi:hypothetical protein
MRLVAMGTVAGDGLEEKPRRDKHRAAVIPLRSVAAAYALIEHRLLPGARRESARLVRDARAERPVLAPAALRAWRTRRQRDAARAAGAVGALLDAIHTLLSVRREALVDIEPASTREFREDIARLKATWLPYLTRLRGRTEWLARRRESAHRPPNALREAVIERLIDIAVTYRLNPRDRLLNRERVEGRPGGLLYDLAVVLRPLLPCLPSGDEALYKALGRACKALGCAR